MDHLETINTLFNNHINRGKEIIVFTKGLIIDLKKTQVLLQDFKKKYDFTKKKNDLTNKKNDTSYETHMDEQDKVWDRLFKKHKEYHNNNSINQIKSNSYC